MINLSIYQFINLSIYQLINPKSVIYYLKYPNLQLIGQFWYYVTYFDLQVIKIRATRWSRFQNLDNTEYFWLTANWRSNRLGLSIIQFSSRLRAKHLTMFQMASFLGGVQEAVKYSVIVKLFKIYSHIASENALLLPTINFQNGKKCKKNTYFWGQAFWGIS